MARAVRRTMPTAEVIELPVADGGEGTIDAVLAAIGGQRIGAEVTGPLGARVGAFWARMGEGTTAVVEMAQASGLGLVTRDQRDPLRTTSHGTGELLAAAFVSDARRVMLAVGGSATVDGGAGALAALGARYYYRDNVVSVQGGSDLSRIDRVDLTHLRRPGPGVELLIAADVTNRMLGEHGAARVFGPQKGATPEAVAQLDEGLANWCRVLGRACGTDPAGIVGGGAAGGLAGGLAAVYGVIPRPGIDVILDLIGFDKRLATADLVITGEGRLDRTTLAGKVVAGIAARCRSRGVALLVAAGSVASDVAPLAWRDAGIADVEPLAEADVPLAQALVEAESRLDYAVTRMLHRQERSSR